MTTRADAIAGLRNSMRDTPWKEREGTVRKIAAPIDPIATENTAAGQWTTVTASDTVVTGLGALSSAVASFETDPADANLLVSCQIGNQAGAPAAGSIIIKTWKTDGVDPTPVAATVFGKKVNWIARAA